MYLNNFDHYFAALKTTFNILDVHVAHVIIIMSIISITQNTIICFVRLLSFQGGKVLRNLYGANE